MRKDTGNGAPMTITGMVGYTVVDTRVLRSGFAYGPLRWKNGQLHAQVKMTDTDRTRWVPTARLEFVIATAARLRAEQPERIAARMAGR